MENVVVLTLPSAARATYTSGPIPTQQGGFILQAINLDVSVTALTGGVSPTVTFKVSRVEPDGVLYSVYSPAAISAAGTFSQSIGPGEQTNVDLGDQFQLDMVLTGGPTSITFSATIKGKGF